MNQSEIKVSVIVPTYKREAHYLLRAIGSLQAQTHENTEIVVVDDNPADSDYRRQVMDAMAAFEQDPQIVYVMNPKNVGGALARNNGIAAASGTYITFLDDDDEYLPRKIEKQLAFMLAEDCDLSFTNLTLVNERKEIVDFRDHSGVERFDNEYLLKYHLMRHLTGTPTFMYKAEKLREIGGFNDAKVSQEFYLMLKSIEAGLKIRYMNESDVIAYRHSDGGISHGQTKINGEKYLYEFKKQYFDRFTAKERRFITFRYHAVMAVAYIRNKNNIKALGSAIRMFFTSPLHLLKEGLRFISNKSKAKKNAG